MVKKTLAIFCVIAICLGIFGCGNEYETEKIDLQNMSAAEILGTFIKAGFPVHEQNVYAVETDPEESMGTPHSYISKAIWMDPRAGNLNNNGLYIEVFENSTDCAARKETIEKTFTLSSVRYFCFQEGNVLFNVQCDLTTAQISSYEAAFKTMAQGEIPVYVGVEE